MAVAVLATLVLASCSDDDDKKTTPGAPAVTGDLELVIRADSGPGRESLSGLICRPGEVRATGPLRQKADAERLCDAARDLSSELTSKPPATRVCTRIYGGPQTARITGTIDGRRVDRTFKRTDGCEIKDYAQIAKILPS